MITNRSNERIVLNELKEDIARLYQELRRAADEVDRTHSNLLDAIEAAALTEQQPFIELANTTSVVAHTIRELALSAYVLTRRK